jgi:hypothetical protein
MVAALRGDEAANHLHHHKAFAVFAALFCCLGLIKKGGSGRWVGRQKGLRQIGRGLAEGPVIAP